MPDAARPPVVEISIGELVDKLTILEIKSERIGDPQKLRHVLFEIESLRTVWRDSIPDNEQLLQLEADLKRINEQIWDAEEAIRECERRQQFDDAFIALARCVYRSNDRRAAVKRQINELFHSRVVEEKSYAAY